MRLRCSGGIKGGGGAMVIPKLDKKKITPRSLTNMTSGKYFFFSISLHLLMYEKYFYTNFFIVYPMVLIKKSIPVHIETKKI